MYRVGIDLGGTNIKAGIVNDNQKILAESSVPTGVERPYEEIIQDMADLVKDGHRRTRNTKCRSRKSGHCGCAQWYRLIFQ